MVSRGATFLLPNSGRCSRLGFGCGAVMGRVGRKASLRAMHAAFDAGVNLFDTARSYGYGEAEGVLAEFAAGKRGQIILSTKFGIAPTPRQRWKDMLKPAARAAVRLVPQLRRAVRLHTAAHIQAVPFTPQAMKASLETSLRELRTDYVDFLFLHDAPPTVAAQDDLFEGLERLRTAGKLHFYGVSSGMEAAQAALAARPTAHALQMPVNLTNLRQAKLVADQALAQQSRVLFANHIFSGVAGAQAATQRLLALAENQALPADIRGKVHSCGASILPRIMLALALRHCGAQAAIVSMMGTTNVAANVAAVAEHYWSNQELDALFEELTCVDQPR